MSLKSIFKKITGLEEREKARDIVQASGKPFDELDKTAKGEITRLARRGILKMGTIGVTLVTLWGVTEILESIQENDPYSEKNIGKTLGLMLEKEIRNLLANNAIIKIRHRQSPGIHTMIDHKGHQYIPTSKTGYRSISGNTFRIIGEFIAKEGVLNANGTQIPFKLDTKHLEIGLFTGEKHLRTVYSQGPLGISESYMAENKITAIKLTVSATVTINGKEQTLSMPVFLGNENMAILEIATPKQ